MILAQQVKTKFDEVYACLNWISRRDPRTSGSMPRLRELLQDPEVLDYLQAIVAKDRERVGLPT